MKSIIYQTQTDKFPRIKISVGQKPEYMDLANFVLSGFNGKDVDIVRKEIIMAADAIEMMLETNIDKAMNKYNSIDLLENNDK